MQNKNRDAVLVRLWHTVLTWAGERVSEGVSHSHWRAAVRRNKKAHDCVKIAILGKTVTKCMRITHEKKNRFTVRQDSVTDLQTSSKTGQNFLFLSSVNVNIQEEEKQRFIAKRVEISLLFRRCRVTRCTTILTLGPMGTDGHVHREDLRGASVYWTGSCWRTLYGFSSPLTRLQLYTYCDVSPLGWAAHSDYHLLWK